METCWEATPIPSFDQYVESILPSSQYFGSSTKFEPGNLLWRLQLVCAYILTKFGEDYNTYAHVIPVEYVAKHWSIEDFIQMSENPKETAGNNVMKRKRKNKVDNIPFERHWLDVDDHAAYDDESDVGSEQKVN